MLVHMAVVQIVHVPFMLHRGMFAARAVSMGMLIVCYVIAHSLMLSLESKKAPASSWRKLSPTRMTGSMAAMFLSVFYTHIAGMTSSANLSIDLRIGCRWPRASIKTTNREPPLDC